MTLGWLDFLTALHLVAKKQKRGSFLEVFQDVACTHIGDEVRRAWVDSMRRGVRRRIREVFMRFTNGEPFLTKAVFVRMCEDLELLDPPRFSTENVEMLFGWMGLKYQRDCGDGGPRGITEHRGREETDGYDILNREGRSFDTNARSSVSTSTNNHSSGAAPEQRSIARCNLSSSVSERSSQSHSIAERLRAGGCNVEGYGSGLAGSGLAGSGLAGSGGSRNGRDLQSSNHIKLPYQYFVPLLCALADERHYPPEEILGQVAWSFGPRLRPDPMYVNQGTRLI